MILDVGCGRNDSFEFTVDRGEVNLDVLKPIVRVNNFVLADAHFLPFRDKVFDKSFFIDVIEHVYNPFQCLCELKRVSSYVVVGTPNCMYLPKIIKTFLRGSYMCHFTHIATYGIPELVNLFRMVGFSNFKIYPDTYLQSKKHKKFNFLIPKSFSRQLVAQCRC